MKLTKPIEKKILSHAKEAAPSECCGLVVQSGRRMSYRPCTNSAGDTHGRFEISADDWMAAEESGEILAVVHSHPDGEPFLSGADRQAQVAQGLPWVLVVSGSLRVFEPVPHLRGRLFEYGKTDCYTLLSDAYRLAGIDLMPVERGEMDSDAEQEKFLTLAEAAGFTRVFGVQAGDVILTTHSGHTGHALLYLGGGEMLHHAYDQLSRRDSYGAYWQRYTHSVWRHKDWQPAMLQAILNDLEHSI